MTPLALVDSWGIRLAGRLNCGVEFIGPEQGMLACGYEGVGRLWPVAEIATRAAALLPGAK